MSIADFNLHLFSNWLARGILGILAVAGVTLALLPWRAALSTSTMALVYLLTVLIGTARWGLSAGLAAAISAFLAYNFFYLPPYYTLRVHATQDLVALIIFLVVATLTSQLVGQARAGQEAARVREREAIRLYELSRALSGAFTPQAIAQEIVPLALETFQAEAIELYVGRNGKKQENENPILVRRIDQDQSIGEMPDAVFPLQASSGLLGEIRLWRAAPLDEAEQRLMQTFATQTTLALERTALAQTETRARILEQSESLKTALLSSVSHDLRTPLATIKAAVTSLLSEDVEWNTQARRDLLAVVDEETDHLNYLVGNLLAMSRIESGALRPNRQWNDLSEILSSSLRRIRRDLADHRVEKKLPEDIPLTPVDYVQLEQVFINLVSNSIKYSPLGSVITITANVAPGGEVILIQVKNPGPPVAEEHLERIFDKFYRVTNAERVIGTGLGLSICKGIVDAHGGRIWAENLPDGFAFNFTLPLTLEGEFPHEMESASEQTNSA